MPYASTPSGSMVTLDGCYIRVPSAGIDITFNVLPDISDQKSAEYSTETIIGRATGLATYSHSSPRAISMTAHFVVTQESDILKNLRSLRALESLVYPGTNAGTTPYVPPPIAQIRCGELLGSQDLCVYLKSYSVKFPTEVAWDRDTYLPYKFDVDLTWEVAYDSGFLPGQERIMQEGR